VEFAFALYQFFIDAPLWRRNQRLLTELMAAEFLHDPISRANRRS
jgi:hypothetical protein